MVAREDDVICDCEHTMTDASPRRVLITGVSGLIGRILFAHLSKNCDVIGLDQHLNPSPRYQLDNEIPVQLEELPLDRFFQCDVTDRSRLHGILREQNVRVVIHLAAVLESDTDPEKIRYVNLQGTKNILEARLSLSHSRSLIPFTRLSSSGTRTTDHRQFSDDHVRLSISRTLFFSQNERANNSIETADRERRSTVAGSSKWIGSRLLSSEDRRGRNVVGVERRTLGDCRSIWLGEHLWSAARGDVVSNCLAQSSRSVCIYRSMSRSHADRSLGNLFRRLEQSSRLARSSSREDRSRLHSRRRSFSTLESSSERILKKTRKRMFLHQRLLSLNGWMSDLLRNRCWQTEESFKWNNHQFRSTSDCCYSSISIQCSSTERERKRDKR